MTDPELKNLIARIAVGGIAQSERGFTNHGYKLTNCSVVEDGSRDGQSRTVQVVVQRDAIGPQWPRVFEFTVRELQG